MVKGRQGERVRLYVRGTVLGYKRSKSNQYENTSLVQIEGVNTKEEVAWYLGKRMAYIYKAKTKTDGTRFRCIWGKVTRPMVTAALSAPSSNPISRRSPWVLKFGSLCTPATYEVLFPAGFSGEHIGCNRVVSNFEVNIFLFVALLRF